MSKQYTFIYGLYDPRQLVDDELDMIRYVGKSDHPLVRLEEHIYNALHKRECKMPVYNWIRKLDKQGVRLQMRILRRVPMKYWQREERSMIATLRAAGHNLLNATDGGDGFSSEEWKRLWADPKFKEKHLTAMNRPEVKAKRSAEMKRYWKDPVTRAKQSVALKRYFEDPAAREKNSAAQKRYFEDPAARAKTSAAGKRYFENPEAREKASVVANRPEVKAKLLATINQPEFKEKHSAALKEAWAMLTPEQKLLRCRNSAKASRTYEVRKANRELRKNEWADPNHRAKQIAGFTLEVRKNMAAKARQRMKRRYKDPAERAKSSAAGKRRYKDPAERAKISATTTSAMQRPEVKANHSAGNKKSWSPCSVRRIKLGRRNVMKSMLRRYVVALEQCLLVARREVKLSMLRRYELCQTS